MNWLKLLKIKHKTDFDQAKQEFNVLRHTYKLARTYLKKKPHAKLFMVLGANQSGKTSLLFASNLKLMNTQEQPMQAVLPTNYCSWWFTDNLVFLDTAGIYSNPPHNNQAYNLAWRSFLKLLVKNKQYELGGLLITVNLPELIHDKVAFQNFSISIRERIYELTKHVANLPIFLIITKTDLIAGFKEFFANLTIEERAQSFGITLAPNTNIMESFENEFNHLLEKLQAQVFPKLHLEREQQKLGFIKDFPFQLESFKGYIIDLISKLPLHHKTTLTGIFFTSSNQQGQPHDNFTQAIATTLGITPNSLVIATPENYRGFFIENVLRNLNNHQIPTKHTTIQRLCILIAALFLLASSLFWLVSLKANLKLLHNSKQLKVLVSTLKQPKRHLHGFTLNKKILHLCNNYVTYTLENQIATNADSHTLYDTLKVYLMLNYPQHFDLQQVQAWFNKIEHPIVPDIKSPQQPNQTLIAAARAQLTALPPSKILELLLSEQDLGTPEKISTIYQTQIPLLAQNLARGNWVLGPVHKPITAIEDVILEARTVYLENCLVTWEQALSNLKIEHCNTLEHTAQVLADLAKSSAPFLKTITSAQNALTQIRALEPKLATRNFGTVALPKIQALLAQLAQEFQVLNSTGTKAAFEATILHLQQQDTLTTLKNLVAEEPEIIKKLYQNIIQMCWQILLDNTQQYIINRWAAEVWPIFDKTLHNTYPLFKDATTQAKPDDFKAFFAPKGLMDNFFHKFIQPFTTTEDLYLVWKTFDGLSIKIPQTFLETFTHAQLIQKMFQSTTVNCVLVPLAATPNIKQFTLNLAGQTITYQPGVLKPQHLTWPGPKPGTVTLDFLTTHGKHLTTTQTGPWAWFKVLDQAELHNTAKLNQYELTFTANENTAIKYKLITKETFNPFIPDIINSFRCHKF